MPARGRHGIFPGIQLLKRALERPQAAELSSRFMPVEGELSITGRGSRASRQCPVTSARIRLTGAERRSGERGNCAARNDTLHKPRAPVAAQGDLKPHHEQQ